MSPRRRAPCAACGRVVAVRFRVQEYGPHPGKARVPHKCPHGRECIGGRLSHGFVAGSSTCPECNAERHEVGKG